MIRRVVAAAVLAGICAGPNLGAYLRLGTDIGDRTFPLRWTTQPIRYFVTDQPVSGVSTNDLRVALARAFSTWSSVPATAVAAEFVGLTQAQPFANDGMSVIGFTSRPDLDSILGSTTFVVDSTTGAVVESDIFLNAAFPWSVSANGQPSTYDVQSIATHEIGHLLGLSHSALGETELTTTGRRVLAKGAVMFPIAYPPPNIDDRTLEADDVAGLRDVYGTAEFRRDFGSISGRVLLGGQGVFGAHVVAFNTTTGTLTGGFTLGPQGRFVIGGLVPGIYVVRAEPLDDADLDGFFGSTAGVDVDFRAGYAPSLVAVPAGGSLGTADIRVSPK